MSEVPCPRTWLGVLTVPGEIEQLRHLLGACIRMTGVREATLRVAELIKERVTHSINSRETLGRSVLKESGNELDCVVGCLAEDLRHR